MFFLGDIALMLELFGFCIALVLLHQAKKDNGLVRAAGIILLIGSLFLAIMTSCGMYKKRAFIEKQIMKNEQSEPK